MVAVKSVFIAHPSHLLTNHRSHGDGLTAFGFIRELSAQGYRLYVAIDGIDITAPFSENVTLYPQKFLFRSGVLHRLEYMLRVRRLFDRLAKSVDFDVVHQMNPVYLGLSLAFIGVRTPVVLGTYIADWPKSSSGILAFIRAAVKKSIAFLQQSHASALLVTTDAAVRSRIVFPAWSRSKTFRVPHGIDANVFSPSDDGALDGRRILFVGNLHRKKGIYELVEAFAIVLQRFPTLELVIAGDGPERGSLSGRLNELGISERVDMVGNVPRESLPALMRSATLLCCPSYGEPLGMVAIEAMASGLPVVATDAGGLGELIDTSGGLTVPVGDSKALARAIESIVSDRALARRMGSHNRARVEETFSWPRVVHALGDVYASVAAARQQGRA